MRENLKPICGTVDIKAMVNNLSSWETAVHNIDDSAISKHIYGDEDSIQRLNSVLTMNIHNFLKKAYIKISTKLCTVNYNWEFLTVNHSAHMSMKDAAKCEN